MKTTGESPNQRPVPAVRVSPYLATPTLLMVLLLLVVTFLASPSFGQAVYGTIFGTVTDNTGAVVPNAVITVTDIAKGTVVTAKTDASGGYLVQHLIADTYKVEAEAAGFSKAAVNNVIVYVDTQPKVDIQLTVGSVNDTTAIGAQTLFLAPPF